MEYSPPKYNPTNFDLGYRYFSALLIKKSHSRKGLGILGNCCCGASLKTKNPACSFREPIERLELLNDGCNTSLHAYLIVFEEVNRENILI